MIARDSFRERMLADHRNAILRRVTPGSLGALPKIDDREPDAHRWLVENAPTDHMAVHEWRELYREIYAYAIPSADAIRVIREHSPYGVLDLGAGNGYWAFALTHNGVDVIARDRTPVETGSNHYWGEYKRKLGPPRSWHLVKPGGPEAAGDDPNIALMLCWPPYNESFAADALAAYRGSTLIFIGEGRSGCTGDDAFFAALNAGWTEIDSVAIPRFEGLHDDLTVYRRNGS